MFDTDACTKFVEQLFDKSALPSLMKYIEIPNLSRTYDENWQTNGRLLQAANHIKSWVESLDITGLKSQIIHDQGYSPLIFTEIKGDLNETIFFYGHYDKQPAFNGWNEGMGATIPVIKDGKLYGRGGADDGYATYGTMLAIKAVKLQGIPIPRCVMITQGDQQSGSTHMSHYLVTLKQRIGNPKIFFCLDSGTFDYQRVWLSTSLRGNLVATLNVSLMKQGMHSGTSSGVVPNCFRVAKILLNRIENAQTGQIHPDFHVNIPAEFYQQTCDLAKIKGQQAVKTFPFFENSQPISKNILTSLFNRAWKPTLTITGQTGFPQCQVAGNVNHQKIQIRFSLRLPPTLDAKKAAESLKNILTKDVPYNAKVEVQDVRAGYGWVAPKYDQHLQATIQQSSKIFFKNEMLNLGQGGSIPLMNTLSQNWPDAQFLITGVLGPASNAHGPNEFLQLNYTKKLICCMAYVLAETSKKYSQ